MLLHKFFDKIICDFTTNDSRSLDELKKSTTTPILKPTWLKTL